MAERTYNVTVNEVTGTLDNELFRKMASKGDITSVSVTECENMTLTVTGTATTTITTDTKTFNMFYVNTEEYGIVHAGGGTMFESSLKDYYSDEVHSFRVVGVKCKMGKGYKAVPCM